MKPQNPLDIIKALWGEWNKTSQPLQERASVLPLGKYEDGSVGMAWPGLLAAPAEGVANFGSQGFGEDAVPFNSRMAFDAAGGAMTGGLGLGLAGGMADNALGSAGGNLMKGASDLPMDLASRMERAREMGFDTERVLYHGTKRDFDEFRLGETGYNDIGLGPQPVERSAVFTAENPALASDYAWTGDMKNAKVLPLMAKTQKTADLSNGIFGKDALTPEFFERNGLDYRNYIWRAPYELSEVMDNNQGGIAFRNALINDGYDSVRFYEDIPDVQGDKTSLAILDPRNIRSVNAAFDPAKSDSANLLAANAPSGAAIPAGMEASQDEELDIEAILAELMRGRK